MSTVDFREIMRSTWSEGSGWLGRNLEEKGVQLA